MTRHQNPKRSATQKPGPRSPIQLNIQPGPAHLPGTPSEGIHLDAMSALLFMLPRPSVDFLPRRSPATGIRANQDPMNSSGTGGLRTLHQ
jgi:hypothetical protein